MKSSEKMGKVSGEIFCISFVKLSGDEIRWNKFPQVSRVGKKPGFF
jgi:hypothetical protein